VPIPVRAARGASRVTRNHAATAISASEERSAKRLMPWESSIHAGFQKILASMASASGAASSSHPVCHPQNSSAAPTMPKGVFIL